MQSEIILIGVTNSELFRIKYSWSISAIISNKILLISARERSSSGVWDGALEAKAFLGFT